MSKLLVRSYLFQIPTKAHSKCRSHNCACIDIFVAKHGCIHFILVVRAGLRLYNILDVSGGSFLVISLSNVRIGDQVVGHIWPEFGSFTSALNFLQNFVWINIALDSHPALFSVHVNWSYSWSWSPQTLIRFGKV